MYAIFSLVTLVFILMSSGTYADVLSLGTLAQNMTDPINVAAGFVSVGCLIIGAACFFAAIIKYIEYRRSPLAVPISKVVWLLIISLLLFILPFAYIVTGNSIPFAVLWGGS